MNHKHETKEVKKQINLIVQLRCKKISSEMLLTQAGSSQWPLQAVVTVTLQAGHSLPLQLHA